MPTEHPQESEVARVALAFAEALAHGDWSEAHSMLAPSVRDDWQPEDLKREFAAMTSYWDEPAYAVKLDDVDSERAYVAIYSLSEWAGTVQEAVDVRVINDDGRWLIDDIVWGRP
jgi:hypothetical protein